MQNFMFNLPTRIIFGPGTVDQVGIKAARLGERAMIVTGKRSAAAVTSFVYDPSVGPIQSRRETRVPLIT